MLKGLLIKLEPDLHQGLKLCAAAERKTMTDIVVSLIQMYVDSVQQKERSKRSRG